MGHQDHGIKQINTHVHLNLGPGSTLYPSSKCYLTSTKQINGLLNILPLVIPYFSLKLLFKLTIEYQYNNPCFNQHFGQKISMPTFFVLAMERAQTSEVESSLEIIIVAIVSGLVVVVIVSLVIYLGCFKIKRPGIGSISHQQQLQQQQQPQSPHNEDNKGKQNKKQKKKGWFFRNSLVFTHLI